MLRSGAVTLRVKYPRPRLSPRLTSTSDAGRAASSTYRADIDGLRALAVLPVVFFHARFPGFAGGFTGVDVFFVISGFLITGVLRQELDEAPRARFSLLGFYERRIRRILPAMVMLLVASLVAALWLDLPGEMVSFADALAATAVFSSNILFWLQAGYFDPSGHTKPLLHLWSLAVEEQFYLVFPLFLFALSRWARPRRNQALVLLAVPSFAFSVWGVAHMPTATFFLLPARGWEFFVGALIALDAVPPIASRGARELCAALGLLSLGAGVVALDALTPFPGVAALLPCIGAALILMAGRVPGGRISGLIGSRPLVTIGLMSYSLYLWHWPMLVFGAALVPERASLLARLSCVALSFVMAWLSWRFVERPFRGPRALGSRRAVFAAAALATSVTAAVGLAGHRAAGWPGRLPDRVRELAAFSLRSDDPNFERCFAWPQHAVAPEQGCDYGAAVAPTIALWSDSHGAPLAPVLGDAFAREQRSLRFLGKAGCPPILGIDVSNPNRPDCRLYTAAVHRYLDAHPELHTVILMARFSSYVDGADADNGPVDEGEPEMVITDAGRAIPRREVRQVRFVRALDATVRGLRDQGRRVFIVYPVPEAGYDVPSTLARIVRLGGDPASFTRSRQLYDARQRWMIPALDSITERTGAVAIHPESLFCDASVCRVYAGGEPLYSDAHHLSRPGARFILPAFGALFVAPRER